MVSQKVTTSLHVASHQQHLKWSKTVPPVLTVDSGSVVSFDAIDGGGGQITPTSSVADLANFKLELADPVFGPVYVNGAEPGDVLKIEILDLEPAEWGWTAIFPGFGLLDDDFTEHRLKIWRLEKEKDYAVFKEGIHVPIRRFLGEMGVAPAEGEHSTIPPLETGGNIDCRHITTGSTLYLPVRVPGALFSCGDGHAAQGDGEVCGTAIETPMKATVRLTVEKNKPYVSSPHYFSHPSTMHDTGIKDVGYYAVLGIDPDLREASRKALKSLIAWLTREKGLTGVESYMLASVAADLKIAEAVDMPNYAVAASLPLGVFVNDY